MRTFCTPLSYREELSPVPGNRVTQSLPGLGDKDTAILRKTHQGALRVSDLTHFVLDRNQLFQTEGDGKEDITQDSWFTNEDTEAEKGRPVMAEHDTPWCHDGKMMGVGIRETEI